MDTFNPKCDASPSLALSLSLSICTFLPLKVMFAHYEQEDDVAARVITSVAPCPSFEVDMSQHESM